MNRRIRARVAERAKERRTTEIAEIQNQDSGFQFEHRDGFASAELSWQPSGREFHIGFRPAGLLDGKDKQTP